MCLGLLTHPSPPPISRPPTSTCYPCPPQPTVIPNPLPRFPKRRWSPEVYHVIRWPKRAAAFLFGRSERSKRRKENNARRKSRATKEHRPRLQNLRRLRGLPVTRCRPNLPITEDIARSSISIDCSSNSIECSSNNSIECSNTTPTSPTDPSLAGPGRESCPIERISTTTTTTTTLSPKVSKYFPMRIRKVRATVLSSASHRLQLHCTGRNQLARSLACANATFILFISTFPVYFIVPRSAY